MTEERSAGEDSFDMMVEVRVVSLCLEEYRMLAVWRVQQAEYPVD